MKQYFRSAAKCYVPTISHHFVCGRSPLDAFTVEVLRLRCGRLRGSYVLSAVSSLSHVSHVTLSCCHGMPWSRVIGLSWNPSDLRSVWLLPVMANALTKFLLHLGAKMFQLNQSFSSFEWLITKLHWHLLRRNVVTGSGFHKLYPISEPLHNGSRHMFTMIFYVLVRPVNWRCNPPPPLACPSLPATSPSPNPSDDMIV